MLLSLWHYNINYPTKQKPTIKQAGFSKIIAHLRHLICFTNTKFAQIFIIHILSTAIYCDATSCKHGKCYVPRARKTLNVLRYAKHENY